MIMKKIFTLIVMLVATLGMQAQDTWTVAGSKAILGENWAPAATENDMTSGDGVNFTLIKRGVMLAAGDYEYKVLKNHAWDESYGNGEGNAVLTINEDAEYTVTFTFNAESKEVGATAEKTGAYVAPEVGDQTWTVAGVEPLCGSNWAPDDTSNDMTSTDGINFTLVKEGCKLEAGVGYGFKIVADHDWAEAYPSDNYMLTVAANGVYTVTITFNSESHEINVNTVKTGEADFSNKVWTIAGSDVILGSNWDPADTNNDMTDAGDGTFILVKKNVALLADTEYVFKVVANHSWAENYGADGVADGPNITFMVDEDGNYDVTFTFNPEDKSCWATADPAEAVEPVKGDLNGDGIVNALDIQAIINAAVAEDANFDQTGDGICNALDIQTIINIAATAE